MRTKHASLISGVDAVAVGYSLGHLTALKNFVGNDRIDARSNTAERGVRGVANGRGRSHGGRDVHTAADRQAERDQPAAPPALRPRAHRPPPSERVDELLPLAVAAKWADEATAPQLPMAT